MREFRLTAHSSVSQYNYRLPGPFKSLLTVCLYSLAFTNTNTESRVKISFRSFHYTFFFAINRNRGTQKFVLTERETLCGTHVVKTVIQRDCLKHIWLTGV